MAVQAPLIVPERVEAFLDAHRLGNGAASFTRIGDGGGSNFTFLVERGDERLVLRRPPRPQLPKSSQDMMREAQLQLAICAGGFSWLVSLPTRDSIVILLAAHPFAHRAQYAGKPGAPLNLGLGRRDRRLTGVVLARHLLERDQ